MVMENLVKKGSAHMCFRVLIQFAKVTSCIFNVTDYGHKMEEILFIMVFFVLSFLQNDINRPFMIAIIENKQGQMCNMLLVYAECNM